MQNNYKKNWIEDNKLQLKGVHKCILIKLYCNMNKGSSTLHTRRSEFVSKIMKVFNLFNIF